MSPVPPSKAPQTPILSQPNPGAGTIIHTHTITGGAPARGRWRTDSRGMLIYDMSEPTAELQIAYGLVAVFRLADPETLTIDNDPEAIMTLARRYLSTPAKHTARSRATYKALVMVEIVYPVDVAWYESDTMYYIGEHWVKLQSWRPEP